MVRVTAPSAPFTGVTIFRHLWRAAVAGTGSHSPWELRRGRHDAPLRQPLPPAACVRPSTITALRVPRVPLVVPEPPPPATTTAGRARIDPGELPPPSLPPPAPGRPQSSGGGGTPPRSTDRRTPPRRRPGRRRSNVPGRTGGEAGTADGAAPGSSVE